MSSQNSPENTDEELRNRAEAVLFATGKAVSVKELSSILRERDEGRILKALNSIRKRYNEASGAIILVEEGEGWKLTVRDKYLPVVRSIVADTELSKSMMETLAVIAWMNPALQSEVIKIRTNKAYDEIKELEKGGFITRQKHGRTMLIKLTEKFFNYFELDDNRNLKEIFRKKTKKGPEQPTLEVYDEKKPSIEEESEHLGALEVYEEPENKESKEQEGSEREEEKEEAGESEPAEQEESIEERPQAREKPEEEPKEEAEEDASPFDAIDLESVASYEEEEKTAESAKAQEEAPAGEDTREEAEKSGLGESPEAEKEPSAEPDKEEPAEKEGPEEEEDKEK